ncbi:hypothetical protein O181_000669 [Austropuccinia psidii MF-1]|uniref:DUF4939 domain-containing protein n=1 Tax=Austropuccinia psidii MF-1 TaxID=1389203 RepID=A0A9Q3B8Y9_9BASI|nr:hypothetical protein [Austropuccinia psidii MF-1]
MHIQHSPPERWTRSQAGAQAVFTPTPRAPLDRTTVVPQLRAQLNRGPHMKGEAPSRKEGRGPRRSNSFSGVVGVFPGLSRTTFKGPGEDGEEGEECDVTEGVPAPMGHCKSEPSLLAIMQEMTQILANIQEASSCEASRPTSLKTSSMKEPEFFDGTQPFKVRSFIQYCKLIFHNYLENFSQDRKKVLYAISFLIGRALKWIEPYLSNITNQDPSSLLKSWQSFKSQLCKHDPCDIKSHQFGLFEISQNFLIQADCDL